MLISSCVQLVTGGKKIPQLILVLWEFHHEMEFTFTIIKCYDVPERLNESFSRIRFFVVSNMIPLNAERC